VTVGQGGVPSWALSVAGPDGTHVVPDQFVMGAPRFKFVAEDGAVSAWRKYDRAFVHGKVLDVVVEPVVRLRASLTDFAGNSIAAVTAFAAPLERMERTSPNGRVGHYVETSKHVDARGFVELELVSKCAYQITFSAPGYSDEHRLVWTAPSSSFATPGSFRIAEFSAAEAGPEGNAVDLGRVKLRRPGAALVHVVGPPPGERRRVILRNVATVGGGSDVSRLTDGTGTARFAEVAPGDYVVHVVAATPFMIPTFDITGLRFDPLRVGEGAEASVTVASP
jgi:hypothetical protein